MVRVTSCIAVIRFPFLFRLCLFLFSSFHDSFLDFLDSVFICSISPLSYYLYSVLLFVTNQALQHISLNSVCLPLIIPPCITLEPLWQDTFILPFRACGCCVTRFTYTCVHISRYVALVSSGCLAKSETQTYNHEIYFSQFMRLQSPELIVFLRQGRCVSAVTSTWWKGGSSLQSLLRGVPPVIKTCIPIISFEGEHKHSVHSIYWYSFCFE